MSHDEPSDTDRLVDALERVQLAIECSTEAIKLETKAADARFELLCQVLRLPVRR